MKKILFSIMLAMGAMTSNAQDNTGNSYAVFYQAPKESYVKSMIQVFDDIRTKKWDKAQKDYGKLEEKSAAAETKTPGYSNTQMQALYPLPQLAMAMLLSTENTMLPSLTLDYEKAYSMLKHALTYKEKDMLRAFLQDPKVNINLDILEDRIENELCKKATSANTEEAYDAVIDTLLPQSLRLQRMKMQREELVFFNVKKNPTEKECLRYLEKYADGQKSHCMSVQSSLDSLRYAALDGSIKGYEDYIAKYPESSYRKKVLDTLEIMEYNAIDSTAAACRRFMEKYPASKYTMEVKKRLTERAYKEVMEECTADAYQRFCKEFPYDVRYQHVFDSLLRKTVTVIYDTVFAGKEPDAEKILASAFYEIVQNRKAAEQKLIESSLVPPRRRNMWNGLTADLSTIPFNSLNIEGIDIKSKTLAAVHIILTNSANEPGKEPMADIFIDFCFEGSDLKVSDIRLDGGSSSQKNNGM